MCDKQADDLRVDEIFEKDDVEMSPIDNASEIEEEQRKLKEIQNSMNLKLSPKSITPQDKTTADSKSVYVGNVDYSVTSLELEQHFHGCGAVSRVSIQKDKFSGHPKGFAYVEFVDKEGMENALAMSDSLLRGRQIKVNPKRTNKPGISTTNRAPAFRGGRGGARGAHGAQVIVKYVYVGGARLRGGARGARGRFAPY